jgi:hypothetical protein
MGHYSAQMGHHFVPMGHEMGHHFDMMGHKMGHQSAKMGHEGTPMDIKMVSHVVIVKRKASRGVSTRFSGAEWLKNEVRVAEADPEPFCDFCGLWYTPTYKFSAQQGWRHGVRSRSLGGTHVATLCNHSDKEGSISVPGIDPSCDLRSKTQSLTNIENDLYQRKTAILIPRYSAVWVVSSTRQPNQRQGGLATPRATKKTRITRVAIATAPSSRGRTGWYLDG